MNFHFADTVHCRRFLLLSLTVFMLQLLPGCGDGRGSRVPVAGIVTIDGEPLKHGSITFLPVATAGATTRPGGASVGEDGRFSVSSFTPNDGLLLGNYQVMVNATEPLGETAQRWHAPKKYANVKTSGLTLEVTNEMEEDFLFTVELSWEGEKKTSPWVEKF